MTKADVKGLPEAVTKANFAQVQKGLEALRKKLQTKLHVDKDGKLTQNVGDQKQEAVLKGTNKEINELVERLNKEMKSVAAVTKGLKKASGGVHHLKDDEFGALFKRLAELNSEWSNQS
jgi:tRNA U34 5-carboxymethylaminomethyl modifying GTPase MnmE/TrmE